MYLKTLGVLSLILATPSAFAAADLTTSIAAAPSTSLVYTNATYTVTVSNIGNKTANNSTVSIQLPQTHTSPQVYLLGFLGTYSSNCTYSAQRLNCTFGSIARNTSRTVTFVLALPVSAAPLVVTATAATTSVENSTSNNSASRTASQTFYAATIDAVGDPRLIVNRHCTGTGLTAWMECTYFPSSISSHNAEFWGNGTSGTITIPGEPAYSGGWSLTVTPSGNSLYFYYDDGSGVVAEFNGWGADGTCFEGLTTFPGSPYVAPYEVCPQ